ncbi:MAG: hypothetical protein BGO67_02720 [Alphaproteobacteria bacterium 41-28]|nr:MAG: hypothetical protein BGO67_02720 [Alphaproteobacteria bacterium 41-28]
MVRKMIRTFVIVTLLPLTSYAAEFIANVDRSQVVLGENLALQLKLSGASAKSSPNISELKKIFNIIGLQQSSSTSIINGQVSTSTSWHYTLMPKKEGEQTIPPITIESSDGLVTSQAIKVSIGKTSQLPTTNSTHRVTISAQLSKRNPYKNEPIIYIVKLVSSQDLANLQLGEVSIENALVEAYGKPKVYDSTHNGSPVKVIEAKYIITPFKPGPLTIPAFVMHGAVIHQEKNSFDPFPNHNFDIFDMLRKFESMNPLDMGRLEPFSVATDPITLEVKKPIQGISPWLPAASLKITENWDHHQTPKVGQPLTRTFTILAEGATKKQLPNLKEQQGNGINLKVYGDTPTTAEDIKDGTIKSWRQESYTLIPQEPGTLTLPEISVAWWNVKENKIAYAKIPERILEVPPIVNNTSKPPSVTQSEKTNSEALPSAPSTTDAPIIRKETTPETKQNNKLLYGIIIFLLIILGLTFLIIIRLLLGKAKLEEDNIQNRQYPTLGTSEIKEPPLDSKQIGEIKSAEELYRYLQSYAFQHWGTAKNVSLDALFVAAKKQNPNLEQKYLNDILISLKDALYADKSIDLEDIKKRCVNMLQTIKKRRKKSAMATQKLPDLNPR